MSYVYMTWRENPPGGRKSRVRGPMSGGPATADFLQPGIEWTVNRPAPPEHD